MARLRSTVTSEGEIATGTAAKTLLQLVAASNHRIALLGFSISFDGVASDAAPIQVDILRQTTAGTMSSATPVKEDPGCDETIQTTAQKNATAEPTAGDVLRRYQVHPQVGIEIKFGADEEIIIPGGGRLGLRVTAAATVNALGHMTFEE